MTSVWNYLWIAYASIVPIHFTLKAYRRRCVRKLDTQLEDFKSSSERHPWHTVEHPVADVQFAGEQSNRLLILWTTHDMVADISKTTLN